MIGVAGQVLGQYRIILLVSYVGAGIRLLVFMLRGDAVDEALE